MKITRVCKNPVKFIFGWPSLFAGLEVLNQVRPVVLEADPGPSGPVNERYRNSGLLAGFRVAKKKSKKSFFQKKFLKIFFSNFFGMILAIIVAMKLTVVVITNMYALKVYYYQYIFLLLQTELL